jgi:ABC-2 type transport system ATP-binding protein
MRWLRNLLREQAAAGCTVLVSSHLLAEIAQTADELVVIRDGKLVAKTSLDEFTTGSTARMRVRCADPTGLASALESRGAGVERDGDGALLVSALDGEAIGEAALAAGIALHELAPLRSSLEERFLELTGEEAPQ